MLPQPQIAPRKVVVVGGGIGALEAVLALRDLGEKQFKITLVAPETHFSLRPIAVATPFARGHVTPLGLAEFMSQQGGTFHQAAVSAVDADRHRVICEDGTELPYDDLVLAPGARTRAAIDHALTFRADTATELNGVLADIDQGWTKSVAFIVPKGCTWPLPLYELALMTAEEAWGAGMDRVHLHLFTPELKPLGLFGDEASDAVAALLDAAQITVHTGVSADIKDPGHVETGFGDPVEVDRVIALPALDGPAITGVPSDARGFISVDDFGRVVGLADVYAAGDATDQPIKQGGLACQQADIVAGDIAARAGARVDVEPLRPVLRGRLLTGHLDRFLRKDVKRRSDVRDEPLWWPPAKVSSRYLAPYLEMEHLISLPVREGFSDHGIDVEIPLWWEKRDRRGVMELNRIER